MKPAVLLMLKDEADIIERCLNHWHSLGVRHFYICDNGSTDGTFGIVSEWARDGAIVALHSDPDPTFAGYRIVNELKSAALSDGCDFIFPADADEFLQLPTGYNNLLSYLEDMEDGHFYTSIMYLNMWPGGGSTWQEPHRKVWGRLRNDMMISIGNHEISGQNARDVAPSLWYKHYQYRSKDQFEKKTVNHGRAFESMGLTDNHYCIEYQKYKKDPKGYVNAQWKEFLKAGIDDRAPKWL